MDASHHSASAGGGGIIKLTFIRCSLSWILVGFMRLPTRWSLLAVMYSLPYAAVLIAGWIWLYQQGWLLAWGLVSALLLGGAAWINARYRKPISSPAAADAPADPLWSPRAEAAWQDVEAYSIEVRESATPLDDPKRAWELFQEVLQRVARRYHPESTNPMLEVPIPHVLMVMELVSRDLRTSVVQNLPGSHLVTINDLRWFQQAAVQSAKYQKLYAWGYNAFRVARLVWNPANALTREMANQTVVSWVDQGKTEAKNWLIDLLIRKAGFYAIELYSGKLSVEPARLAAYQTSTSVAQLEHAATQEKAETAEPLRILIIGQVKAGKSSLVNALFGEVRAAVDIVPRTKGLTPYTLEKEGLPRALLYDTAGYDEAGAKTFLQKAQEQILQCDLVLLVCSAQSAARQSDRQLLDAIRQEFQARPDHPMPPVVVVMTHIDRLRPFAEWNPPYDIAHPHTPKAEQIAAALSAISTDLGVVPWQVVPVCLAEGRIYNVNEGLTPTILQRLPEAQRVRYLRCLQEFRDEYRWSQLWDQAVTAGQVLYDAGKRLLKS